MLALGSIVAATAALVAAQAPPVETKPEDQLTVQLVATLLERGHLAKPTINDEISKKWCRNYLKALDYQKFLFLKADIDEFLKHDTELDDTIATGNLDLAKQIFDRFEQRVAERQADAMEILKEKPDFTVEESIADDPDRTDYPADAAEAKDRLRKRIKLALLGRKIGKVTEDEAMKQTAIFYKDLFRTFRQYDHVDLLERYLTALTMTIDPHSGYIGAKEYEDTIDQRLHLTLDGIGASLQTIDGFPTVMEVVPGGAADKDGRLQVDDKILGIVKDDGTRENFVEKKLSDVVRQIRGKRGSIVKIVVQPAESKEEKIYEITRAKIDLNSDKAKGQVIESKAADGKARTYGIIHIPSFYGNMDGLRNGEADAASVTRDCRRILEEFKEKKVDAVIVDLRMNPGGLLPEAISLSGLFIDKGPVVQVRDARGVNHLDDEDEGTAWDGPLAVVVDHYCASASEIFAGVMKDYGRGLIIGDTSTFGKGSVQNIEPLNKRFRFNSTKIPDLGALKLTIQQFYLPNGESTQIRGVASDVHIPSYGDFSEYSENKYDSALKFDKVAPLPHDLYNKAPAELVKTLIERSNVRRKANEKFQEEEKFLQRVAEQKKRHEISLNEAKFRAEMKVDDEADAEAKSKTKSKSKKTRRNETVWESGYYNDEVLNIVNDYLTLGSNILVAAPTRAPINEGELPQRP